MGPIRTLDELLDLLKRRWKLIVAVFLIGTVGSLIYALNKQHLYQSVEVVQVQSPMVAGGIAPDLDTESSGRRLQLIEQQIMTRQSLLDIIDELELFQDLRGLTDAERAQLLRESVRINGVAAARVGFADDGSVSLLRVTATMSTPEDAQRLAQEITRRTIEMSTGSRLQRAFETLEFVKRQEVAVEADIAGLEAEIATFRQNNILSDTAALDSRRREVESINAEVLGLEQQIVALQQTINQAESAGAVSLIEQRRADEARQSIDSLTLQRNLLRDRADNISATIQSSPELERQLASLERRLVNKQAELAETQSRRNDAELAYQIEADAQAERLMVIEPANLPDYPVSGSRKVVALAGAIAALIGGLVLAYAMDIVRPVLRSTAQMEREIGLRPIVTIPEIDAKRPKRQT